MAEHNRERDRMRRAANKARHQTNGIPEGEKVCPRCGQRKSLDQFNVVLSRKDGHDAFCRECRRAYGRAWAAANRAKGVEYTQKWQKANPLAARLTRHPISVSDFLALLVAQDGQCGICRFRPDDPARLHVDHDHQTGRVRGLLCHPCNTGLGKLGDSEEGLLRALAYLKSAP